MDVAKMSMVLNQASLQQQASLAILKKAMVTAEDNADGLIHMLQQSVGNEAPHPYLGNKIDMKV